MRTLRETRLLVAATLCLLAAGCDDKKAPGTCTRSEKLLSEVRSCLADEDCPCGAGCELGLCKAGCSQDSACSGGTCDRFGRCQASGASPTLQPGKLTDLKVSTSLVRISDPATPRGFTLQREAGEGPVRIQAPSGVQVRCGASGEFGSSCTLAAADASARNEITVKADDSVPLDASRPLQIFSGPSMTTVGVTRAPIGGRPAPTTTAVVSGVYEGTARLVAQGVGEDASAAVAVHELSARVSAQVFAPETSAGTLVLTDPIGLLNPAGKWTASLAATGGDVLVDFPTVVYLSSSTWAGAPIEVLADAPAAPVTVTGESVSFDLAVRYAGVLGAGRALYSRWSVTLSKTADLPTGAVAPSVPADAVPTLDAARALIPTPWEAAALGTFGTVDVTAATPERKRELLSAFTLRSDQLDLAVCSFQPSQVEALGRFATVEAWGVTADAVPVLPQGLLGRLKGAFGTSLTADLHLSVTPGLRPRWVACDVTFTAMETGSTCVPSSWYRLAHVDFCDDLAAAYGCEITAAPANATFLVEVSGTLSGTACSETLPAKTVSGAVARGCRLPVIPQGCAEALACYAPPDPPSVDPSSLVADRLGSTAIAQSGDLACPTAPQALFPLDVRFDQCPISSPACDRLGADGVLKTCAAEWKAVREATPGLVPAAGAGLKQLFQAAPACVDLARWLAATGLATDSDRRRAAGDVDAAETALASRIGHRLLQRLLLQAGFQAREAQQRAQVAGMFPDSATQRTVPTPEQTLAEVLPLWDLLLHPRFAAALDQVPGAVLAAPDYRPVRLGTSLPAGSTVDQMDGLPLTMARTLAAELALYEPRLDEAALSRDTSAMANLGSLLRYQVLLWPMVADMTARARTAAGATAPSWSKDFDAAANELTGHVDRLLLGAEAMLSGRNPLGIEENDLPLYFLGDEATATTRFSAISDFLVGQKPGTAAAATAWAPALVQIAQESWDAAMPLYIQVLDRQVQLAQAEVEHSNFLDAMRLDFGSKIGEICYPSNLATKDYLEQWDFSEETCFYNSNDPSCAIDAGAYGSLMTVGQVRYQMCLAGQARLKVSKSISFVDTTLDAIADGLESCQNLTYPATCPSSVRQGARCVSCNLNGKDLVAPLSPDTFRMMVGVVNLPGRLVNDLANGCLDKYPSADPTLPSAGDLPSSPVAKHECYNGSLGEAVFALHATHSDMESTSVAADIAQQRYDTAAKSCAISYLSAAEQQTMMEAHEKTIASMRQAKLALETIVIGAEEGEQCLSAINDGYSLDSLFLGTIFAGVRCAADLLAGSLKIGELGVDEQMAQAEAAYAKEVATVQANADFQKCMNDASMELLALKDTAQRMKQLALEVEADIYRIQELKISVRTLMDDGRAALAVATAREVPPLTHDLWLNDSVDRLVRDMRLARRVTYLAVRAVEYELQQSLPQRSTVLAAKKPNELWAVVEDLWSMTGTRTLNGHRPTDLKVVLSLRKQLLQLADRSQWSAEEQALSDVERFRLLLASPRYAVYGNDGAYQGQRIPFSLAPLGAIKLGQSDGVPVLAGSDCGERLWSVSASVLGTDLYRGDAPTFTRIDLLKSNTFFSQWCQAPASGPTFQVASVRPARNLFRDPVSGGKQGVGTGGLSTEEAQESRARMEAYFNVDRAQLEKDDYQAGSTSELAARGLYGDYALFVPAEALSVSGSDGLVLASVDDILLRLDYVSVAR